MATLIISFILGLLVGSSIIYFIYKDKLDDSYLNGFVDFHRKDLSKIKEVSPRLLKKYDIKLGNK